MRLRYDQCSKTAGYRSIDYCANIILRDYIFLCPSRRAAAAQTLATGKAVWQYQFVYESSWKV